MLDLAQYFFGSAALEINRLDSAVVKSDYVRVSFTDDNLKYCELSFGYSDNYSIELLADGQRIQVKPLEILNIYDEMEILQPDETFTFKRYIPKATENNSNYMVEDSFLKPGFELQYMEFFDFVKGIKSNKAANLKDAIRVSTFALGLQNLLANHINSG